MLKEYFYDWGGLNQEIFLYLNNTISVLNPDKWILFSDKVANYKNYFYFIILLFCIKLFLIVKNRFDSEKLYINIQRWAEIIFIAVSSFFFNVIINYTIKENSQFVRPVCDKTLDTIYLVKDLTINNCNHSFPSGHTMIATIMVMSCWSALNIYGRALGVFYITSVALSRISAGMHFPADVLYSLIITLVTTHTLKHFALPLFRRTYGLVKAKFIKHKESLI